MNGSPSGVIWLDIEPTQRARMKWLRVRVELLGISLEQPEAFAAALEA